MIADVDGQVLPVTPLVLDDARSLEAMATSGSRTLFPETAREQNSATSCAAIMLFAPATRRAYKI